MPKIRILEPDAEVRDLNIKLKREKITIGRKPSNDIVLEDISISSYHCQIRRVLGGYILDDLNSTNGCKIKKQAYFHVDLEDDTLFRLGDVKVEFLYTDEEIDELEEEASFQSEQKKRPLAKQGKKKRSKKNHAAIASSSKAERKSKHSDREAKDAHFDEDGDGEEENEYLNPNRGFYITLISFIITIVISFTVLYLTGNL